MKKTILILLLLAFAGASLADMPEIVNPPRPSREFKWLLVCGYKPVEGKIFIYTNKFRVEKVKYDDRTRAFWLFLEGDLEILETYKFGVRKRDIDTYPYSLDRMFFLANDSGRSDYHQNFFFLKMKAPSPVMPHHLDLRRRGPATQELKPLNAKVVFTK